jgi:hypothetical protein
MKLLDNHKGHHSFQNIPVVLVSRLGRKRREGPVEPQAGEEETGFNCEQCSWMLK